MKLIPQLILLSAIISITLACQPTATENKAHSEAEIARQEARDDSLELVAAFNRQAKIQNMVYPTLETEAVDAGASLDAADDPAIWVHPTNPEESIIIGSNKKGGLHLYDLKGKELAYFPVGNINNVDVLPDFQLGDQKVNLIGGSNRSDQSIDLFVIDPKGLELKDISADALWVDSSKIDDIYGFCFYFDKEQNRPYVFINGKNGRLQQFELIANEDNKVEIKKVRDVLFDGQVEGMVADEWYNVLYVGEEDKGIWKLSTSPEAGDHKALISMSTEENPQISYDIEGLTLYEDGEKGYLIASSQGNFSYAVFDRGGSNDYITSFVIKDKGDIDGVEETDGIQAISLPLGKDFPRGVFIAQDGFNDEEGSLVAQNFKVVDWREIAGLLEK